MQRVDLPVFRKLTWCPLAQSQSLQGGCSWLSIEDRIDVLHDIGVHIQEVALILYGYEGTLGAVVFGDLEGFDKGANWFYVALDAHVAKDQGSGSHRALSDR